MQKYSAKSFGLVETAAALAHEMNQPLTSIQLYTQSCLLLLQKNLAEDQIQNEMIEALKQISSQAVYAGKIVQRSKNGVDPGIPHLEPHQINKIIHEVLYFLSHETSRINTQIELDLEENLPQIQLDKVQIIQVIMNLIRNSIEAIQGTPNPLIMLQTKHDQGFILINCQDNGVGIEPQHQEKILESGFSTKSNERGLGLSICKKIVEAHGGEVYLKKTKQGASLIVSLPVMRHDHL